MKYLMLPSGNREDLPGLKKTLKTWKVSYVLIEYKAGGFLMWFSAKQVPWNELNGYPLHKYPNPGLVFSDMFIGHVIKITTYEGGD